MGEYRVRRFWLLPFLVEVWWHDPWRDWRGRTYWRRIGTFYSRGTANAFVRWHTDTQETSRG